MYKLLDSVGIDFIGRMCLTSDPLTDDPASIDELSLTQLAGDEDVRPL